MLSYVTTTFISTASLKNLVATTSSWSIRLFWTASKFVLHKLLWTCGFRIFTILLTKNLVNLAWVYLVRFIIATFLFPLWPSL